jgi:hypothetical protein
MLEYQRSETAATLGEGLAEYYASCTGLVRERGVSGRAREFFACHDAAHVVFGCSTELLDEARVKLWSVFGTTGGLALLREYRLPEAKELYQELDWGPIAKTALRGLVAVPVVLVRCARMKKRWPWAAHERYRRASLREIRQEYGIRVVT